MPRRARTSTAGLVFHIMNRGAKRTRMFDEPSDYDAFEAILAEGVTRAPVHVFTHIVMPNHWHLVAEPREDGALSQFLHWVTTTHSRRWQLHRNQAGEGAVYQGRYKAIPIQSDRHFLWVCRYVERNAARASLVANAQEWQWSALWRRCNGIDTPWLAEWPVPRPENWLDEVNRPQTEGELDVFRKSVARGRPFGDSSWEAEISCRLGLTKRRRGRPRKTPDPGTVENDSRPLFYL